ncbi:hypothetical protein TGRUB_272660 [Toxoplasma gondii RUB]|uniref:Inhibitor of cysteine protease 2 n=11 Tax=Toxoplasma gondii TaxID=5811 RepID=B9PFS7_TOXGV|nr:hypothetical protein TGGT1_272660 [Toxoplasma gondii GT1]ESS35951.1 hypothetical protein TGVEG_272660 [Toxoplasma gondii VEG]KAF4642094.1 hypothetical protein TGRH88_079070 [Toxoplasma gondii]KFG51747.1 hypothetical protein TGP89_272660 [Toxoplasma gondii p89]KFG64092.1 hypothetical protein TGRUB_272660 [Toxoplasma gondii RUB]KFH11736.1 hypothetical protein TGVAND_272660 [Toxoplasma gondii VAND]RQX75495.1 hypothetical protein TGCAST_272660 [Toxoplasma gondii CAST]
MQTLKLSRALMPLTVVAFFLLSFSVASCRQGTSPRAGTAGDGETCTETPVISFLPVSGPEHPAGGSQRDDAALEAGARTIPKIHFAHGRARAAQEKPLKVEFPATLGTGYALVVLDVYRGLDFPLSFRDEIRQKLGGKRGRDAPLTPASEQKEEKQEEKAKTEGETSGEDGDIEDVLFLKVFAEPTKKHGVVVSSPEKSMRSTPSAVETARGKMRRESYYESEISSEVPGDFAVAFALVRPWKLSDQPQVFVALVHFD